MLTHVVSVQEDLNFARMSTVELSLVVVSVWLAVQCVEAHTRFSLSKKSIHFKKISNNLIKRAFIKMLSFLERYDIFLLFYSFL